MGPSSKKCAEQVEHFESSVEQSGTGGEIKGRANSASGLGNGTLSEVKRAEEKQNRDGISGRRVGTKSGAKSGTKSGTVRREASYTGRGKTGSGDRSLLKSASVGMSNYFPFRVFGRNGRQIKLLPIKALFFKFPIISTNI